MADEPWPIAETYHGECVRFGLPEGVGPAEVGADLRGFDELGIDDWRRQLLPVLAPGDRPFGASLSRPSWRMSELSRHGHTGRAAWDAGARWRAAAAGATWVTVPAMATAVRSNILASLGCADEMAPELIVVPTATSAGGAIWNRAEQWCTTPGQWSMPEALITAGIADRVIVLHDGWLFVAAAPSAVADVRHAIHMLANHWGVRVTPGPSAWSWFPAAH